MTHQTEQEIVEQYIFKINGEVNHASLNEIVAESFPEVVQVSKHTAYVQYECIGCFEGAVMDYVEDEDIDENVDIEYSIEITPFLYDAVVNLIDCFEITSYEFDQERAVIYFDDIEVLKEFVVIYSDAVDEFLLECAEEDDLEEE